MSSTPRVLKEADTLSAAGYRVHIVAARNFAPSDRLDDALLAQAPWQITRLSATDGPGALARKLMRQLARRLIRAKPGATVRLAARVQYAGAIAQTRLAARLRADLYLGHQLAGLPMAVLAAQAAGTLAGFDLEDYHDGETAEAMRDPALAAAAHILQSRLLPACRHLTAASPLIAEKYAQEHGVNPQVLLNVFPLSQAPLEPAIPPPITAESPAVLYWFSQTVGPGRGLEAMVRAAARMHTPVELQLRGHVWPDYRAGLDRLAREVGLARPIRFLPLGPATEMARLAAHAHLGLSTEEANTPNHDLCLANKSFIYLLAGLPQLLSATRAHRLLAPGLGAAARLVDLPEHGETARTVDALLSDPRHCTEARAAAWRLGRERYNWDFEQSVFLASVRRLVPLSR